MGESDSLVDGTRHLMTGKAKDTTEAMETSAKKWTILFLSTAMWALLALNVSMVLLLPTERVTAMLVSLEWKISAPESTFNGNFGVFWGAPIFLLVFFGSAYLYLFPRASRRPVKRKARKAGMGAHPVIVSGPFGVLSMAELLCIVAFVLTVMWLLYNLGSNALQSAANMVGCLYGHMAAIGVELALLGQLCLMLLFLPVSRGSVLLRLIDVPFEHAVKYHVWLGHFTMTIFSLHGFAFISSWLHEGELIEKLLSWNRSVWDLPGVVALLAGLCSGPRPSSVRESRLLSYSTTHISCILSSSSPWQCMSAIFFSSIYFAGIFLFAFDRFLRFVQSRKEVGIMSAKVLSCGTFELVLSKPANLQYNALSFLFVNIPSLGRLQWHPFSVSSSPKDCSDSIKFLIKPSGTWTRQLNKAIDDAATAQCPLRLTAAVEGPYGHESSYFLK